MANIVIAIVGVKKFANRTKVAPQPHSATDSLRVTTCHGQEVFVTPKHISAISTFQRRWRSSFFQVDRQKLSGRLHMELQFQREGCRWVFWALFFLLFALCCFMTIDRRAQLGVHQFLYQHLALDQLDKVYSLCRIRDWNHIADVA